MTCQMTHRQVGKKGHISFTFKLTSLDVWWNVELCMSIKNNLYAKQDANMNVKF